MNSKATHLLRSVVLMAAMMVCAQAAFAGTKATVRQMMDAIARQQGVSFVYDSSLALDAPYTGEELRKKTLDKCLDALFTPIGIAWERRGRYVMLRRKAVSRPLPHRQAKRMTLSGYVRDSIGESLIRATVYDAATGSQTITNEYGFFSITLPEGDHDIRVSYLGFADLNERISLTADRQLTFVLKQNATLGEVTVTAERNSSLINSQTGHRQLTGSDLNTEFALLSSPDLVKTLQQTSGVSQGIELLSGMYVHGGGADENLFLLDGTPLYQVNHTFGLFSAFNTDIVKRVDFFKSGFPARYGGRLSSVTDVRTIDGDMYATHGSWSLGLLDGRFNIQTPLQKGRTALVFGLRRSWADLLARPIIALANSGNDEKVGVNFFYHDLNAKLTHIFNPHSRAYLSICSGRDRIATSDKMSDTYSYGSDRDETHLNLTWGNFNAAFNWNYVFSPKLFANIGATFTHNLSRYNYKYDNEYVRGDDTHTVSKSRHGYRSTIYDTGVNAEFDYRPAPVHHIRFGGAYTWHVFRPQTYYNMNTSTTAGTPSDTIITKGRNRHTSHEINFYGEDNIRLGNDWSLNGGLNMSLFSVGGKAFTEVDPRLSLRWQMSRSVAAKLSWTMMTQYVHRIANTYLDMPTDYWVPTTKELRPMRSWQIAGGVYAEPWEGWRFSVEGYYKRTRHLLQYTSWAGLEPPADSWEKSVMDGEGMYYGGELDASYTTGRLSLSAAYTLSWSKRRFNGWYDGWFYDKFDNRHKLNINARMAFSSKVSAYAAWTYHSGNRMTVPTQYIAMPGTPGTDSYGKSLPTSLPAQPFGYDYKLIYEHPNNVSLPAYHRLDIGLDFRHTTPHGHERVWNVSVYNAYCHLNTMFVEMKQRSDGTIYAKTYGYIPIVPTVSYTYKF